MEDNRLNIFNKSYVINTMKSLGIKPLKRLGQNFLIDKNVVSNIVSLIPENSFVLEIGAGLGHMRPLSGKVKRYIGIEIDRKLSSFLVEEGLNVINCDFLKVDLNNLINEDCIILGNLPYYITTPIIVHIIRNISKKINSLILLVQKEFAMKLKDFSIKSPSLILIRHYFDIHHIFNVSKNSFYPVPHVDSSVIKLINKGFEYEKGYEDFLKKIFSHKRKSFVKFLDKCKIKSLDIKENVRIEQIEDFYTLYKVLR